MTVLLALTALLLTLSGVINLRAASRAGMSLHLPSLIELVGGLGLGALLMGGSVTPALGLGVVVGAVLLIVGSSVHLGRRLQQLRRLRDLTEGRRLESYVKYLSEVPDVPDVPEAPKAPQAPEVPAVPEASGVPEAPEASEEAEVPEDAGEPEASETPKEPEEPGPSSQQAT